MKSLRCAEISNAWAANIFVHMKIHTHLVETTHNVIMAVYFISPSCTNVKFNIFLCFVIFLWNITYYIFLSAVTPGCTSAPFNYCLSCFKKFKISLHLLPRLQYAYLIKCQSIIVIIFIHSFM